jgi:hypothetical protein
MAKKTKMGDVRLGFIVTAFNRPVTMIVRFMPVFR